jgi:hypothetical protein
VDKKVFMDRHVILSLLRAVAATTPAEVEEGVTDFLRRLETNAKLHENKTKITDLLFFYTKTYESMKIENQ